MDSVQFKKYYTTVKNFLLGPKNKEFLIFLFFFFVSAAFWLLQSLNETFDVELKVPLKLENVPSDVVITSDLPSDLNVMVRDKGTVLVRYIYGTEQDVFPLRFWMSRRKYRHSCCLPLVLCL